MLDYEPDGANMTAETKDGFRVEIVKQDDGRYLGTITHGDARLASFTGFRWRGMDRSANKLVKAYRTLDSSTCDTCSNKTFQGRAHSAPRCLNPECERYKKL